MLCDNNSQIVEDLRFIKSRVRFPSFSCYFHHWSVDTWISLCFFTPELRLMEPYHLESGKNRRESETEMNVGSHSIRLKGQTLLSLIFYWPNQIPWSQLYGQVDKEMQCDHMPGRKRIQKVVKSPNAHLQDRKGRAGDRGAIPDQRRACGKTWGLEGLTLETAASLKGWSLNTFHILIILSILIHSLSSPAHQYLGLCLSQNLWNRIEHLSQNELYLNPRIQVQPVAVKPSFLSPYFPKSEQKTFTFLARQDGKI